MAKRSTLATNYTKAYYMPKTRLNKDHLLVKMKKKLSFEKLKNIYALRSKSKGDQKIFTS